MHLLDPVDATCGFLADTFIIPGGISAGEPFHLHEYERRLLAAYLGTDGGSPRYRTLVFSLPRKTGKSTFMGALLLARMLPDSPIYRPMFRASIVAPNARFARFIPQAAIDLMEAVDRGEEISLRHAPSPGRLVVGNGYAQLLSGDGKSGHGDDVDLAIMDEGGLFPHRQDELFEATYNSLAARDGVQIVTGTRLDSDKYRELIETPAPGKYVQLHAADPNCDPGDPAQPWKGRSPFALMGLSPTLLAEIEAAISGAMPMAGKGLLPMSANIPEEQQSKVLSGLRTGSLATVMSKQDFGHQTGGDRSELRRVELTPDLQKMDLNPATDSLHHRILSACGIPPALVTGQGNAGAMREAYRLFALQTVEPLGRQIMPELASKLNVASLSLDAMMSADTAGRARSVGALVNAGVPVQTAMELVGWKGVFIPAPKAKPEPEETDE